MHTGGGFLGDTHHGIGDLGPTNFALGLDALEKIFDYLLLLAAGLGVDPVAAVLQLDAFVNEQRRVAAVIDDLIRPGAVRPDERLDCAVPVFHECLAFPRKHRHASRRNRRRRVILRGENIARTPANIRAQVNERLDEHGSLNGHVQRAHDLHAGKRFFSAVLFARGHQARHFLLGNANFLAAEIGQFNVPDSIVHSRFSLCSSHQKILI